MKVAVIIVTSGAVGGLMSWVLQTGYQGFPPFHWVWYLGMPAFLLFGGCAAFLGVFLVANTDTKDLKHAAAFALACGIGWQPIIQGSIAIVTQAQTGKSSKDLGEKTSQLQQLIKADGAPDAHREAIAKKVEETAGDASALTHGLSEVTNDETKKELEKQYKVTFETLEKASNVTPTNSIRGFASIRHAAESTGQFQLLGPIEASLDAIGSRHPELLREIEQSKRGLNLPVTVVPQANIPHPQ